VPTRPRQGGVCITHGSNKKRCSHKGCTNQVVKGGVCVTHGAKVKRCNFKGCNNIVVKGGVCVTHGAKVKRCSFKGCANRAVKGGVCITHGAKVKPCSFEGCTNNAKKGGVCKTHGAKVQKKQCSFVGSNNQVQGKGGEFVLLMALRRSSVPKFVAGIARKVSTQTRTRPFNQMLISLLPSLLVYIMKKMKMRSNLIVGFGSCVDQFCLFQLHLYDHKTDNDDDDAFYIKEKRRLL
jgi:hypothetical protein